MKYRNEVITIGRMISKRRFNEEYDKVTLIVKSHTTVYPSFLCKKEDIPKHKKHTYFEVKGYAETSRSENGEHFIPRLHATSIKPAETLIEKEFGAKGRFWEEKPCKLYISGAIENIEEIGDYVRYTIATEKPNTTEPVLVKLDWRKIERHPEFKIGDEICAICKITTPRKMIGTEDRIFLNFNVFDMDYLPK